MPMIIFVTTTSFCGVVLEIPPEIRPRLLLRKADR